MLQSKFQSVCETGVQIGIGFGIAVVTGMVAYPIFHYKVPLSENMGITAIFTVTSIIRQYFVRRLFNRIHARQYANRYQAGNPNLRQQQNSMDLQRTGLCSDPGIMEELTGPPDFRV